jgi:FkbM family methyltransferase|nr:MAG: FkbM family methyltransferase [Bacteroidota bacterium]
MGMTERVLGPVFRKKKYQKLFERIYSLGLRGMNYGFGGNVHQSGEIGAIKYVRSKVKTDRPVVFDVGANMGGYTIELLKYFQNADIYCFEPSKKTFEILKNNLNQKEGVHLCNFGFGEKAEFLELYSDAEGSGLASLYNRRLGHMSIQMERREQIEIRTIDQFCRDQNISNIDFLKLDIEGHEMAALRGASEMLNKNAIRFIQFEFGGCNIDSRTYFQDFWYLLHERYKIYRIVRDGLIPCRTIFRNL